MGNTCNTCNCDGKGEAQPNEFSIQVRLPNLRTCLDSSIGTSIIHEKLQLVEPSWIESRERP